MTIVQKNIIHFHLQNDSKAGINKTIYQIITRISKNFIIRNGINFDKKCRNCSSNIITVYVRTLNTWTSLFIVDFLTISNARALFDSNDLSTWFQHDNLLLKLHATGISIPVRYFVENFHVVYMLNVKSRWGMPCRYSIACI